MEQYRNLNQHSGVVAFAISGAGIAVKFVDGKIYEYSNESAGRDNIEQMKRLARAGQGLSTFISQKVKGAYARKRQGAA